MIFKTSQIKFLIIIMISILLVFIFTSCAPASAEKIDVGAEEKGVKEGDKTEVTAEEETEEFEEIFEVVDYENAEIGAEIKGYIPSFLCTDNDNYIKIEITNTSDFTWRNSGENRVRIGYHFYGQDVDYSEYDKTTRTTLPGSLKPGETATVEVLVNDITHKGFYVLQIDPVLEGLFWFSSKDILTLNGRTYFSSCTD